MMREELIKKRDYIFGLLAEIVILGATIVICRSLSFSGLKEVVAFIVIFHIFTFLLLWCLRSVFPLKEGTYSYVEQPLLISVWNLQAFLYSTNLLFFYNNPCFLPPMFRSAFYKLLGAQVGGGGLFAGTMRDPPLIAIEDHVIVGADCFLMPHAVSSHHHKTLTLGRICVKKGAVLGAKACLLPGVVVGENSLVLPMSLVTRDTQIPSNEIWGGVPAKKIKEISVNVRC